MCPTAKLGTKVAKLNHIDKVAVFVAVEVAVLVGVEVGVWDAVGKEAVGDWGKIGVGS